MSQSEFIPALRYHVLTPLYDKFIRLVVPERQIKLRVIELANPSTGDKLLDFGCGTGTLLKLLAEQHATAKAYGVDIDERMMRVAKIKLEKFSDQVTLVSYEGGKLPFENNLFDTVVSSWVFHHFTDEQKVEAFEQIFAKLKPSGKLIIADWGKPSNLLMRLLFFCVQVVDNFKTTAANVAGKIPHFMRLAGFENVKTIESKSTPLGTLAYYTGEKPG